MGRKVIFCDIEDVLVNREDALKIPNPEIYEDQHYTAVREPGPKIGRRYALILNHLAKNTDASVVVHSPWRLVYPVNNIECWLRSQNYESSFGGVTVGNGRWMSIFRAINLIGPKKIVILDGCKREGIEIGDSQDAKDALKEFVVPIENGLTITDMRKAMDMLESK